MNKQILYVKESELPSTKTRKAFLKAFIMNGGYNTYFDKECTKIQCNKVSQGGNNSYRSVTELHAILQSRFKLTTLKATVRILKEIILEEKNIVMVWCTQIKKCVIKYYKNMSSQYMTDYSKDRYYTTKGVDGYSLKDFDDIYKSL